MQPFIPDELQDRRRLLRLLEAVAHFSTAIAFSLTIVLVTTGLATELNTVADTLFGTVGWAASGVAAVAVIAVAFWYYEQHLKQYPRLMLSAGAFLAFAGLADLSVNLWLLVQVGLPAEVWWAAYGLDAGVVLGAGLIAATRHWYAPILVRGIRANKETVRAIGIALLVATSLVAMPFMGGVAPNADHDGTVSAAEGEFTENGTYTGHGSSVLGLTGDGDGHIYSGGMDGVSNKLDKSDLSVVESHSQTEDIQGAFYGDGGYLYLPTQWTSQQLKKVDPSDMSVVNVYTIGTDTRVYAATMGPDGYLYIASQDHGTQKIDPSDMSLVAAYDTHQTWVYDVAFGPNGYLYSAGKTNNELHKIDPSDMSQVDVYAGHGNGVRAVATSDTSVYSGATDGEVHKINPGDMSQSSTYTQTNTEVRSVLMGDDGYLYAGDNPTSGPLVHRIDPSDMSQQDTYSGHANGIESLYMDSDGYVYSGDQDGEIHKLDPHTTITEPVSGQVTDREGDPVSNATVYTVGYDAANPPTIDGTPFDEMAANPLPDGWSNQLNQDWADRGQIDTDGTNLDGTRVLMHTRDQWNLDGHVDIGGRQFMAQADLSPPKAAVSPDDDIVLSCWDTQPSSREALFEDNVGSSLPGATIDNCDGIVVEKMDPTGAVEQRSTFQTHTELVVGIQSFDSTSTTYEAAFPSLGQGIYKVHPEGSPENAIYYAVAPNGDVNVLEAELENWASDRAESISKYNDEIKAEYDAGNLEIVSTTTNETGHYTLDVPDQATKAELRVIKDGGQNAADPENLSRADLRDEIDTTVKANFNAETGVSFSEADEETFTSVCKRMDPIADNVGVPFYGEATADVPLEGVDIEGQYLLPSDLDPRVQQCASISLVSSLLNDIGDFLDPGLADDLQDLSDVQLERLLSQVQGLIEHNDALCEEFATQVHASSCEDALEDPGDLSRDELENRVDNGYDVVDDSSDHTNGGGSGSGGGGGLLDGGGDNVDVGDGETSIGNETFTHEWPVGGVGDWSDAEVMIRLQWSNGTTTVLNQSSEYVSVDESIVGADTVRIAEYPIGDQDPAALQARIDVVTQTSSGSGDSAPVKNPTWNGDLPSVASVKVSKWFPGADDSFSVSVDADDEARFGALKRVEVTEPDGGVSTYQPTDGEVTARTNGTGDHRVAVVFSAADDNATEFTEVVTVKASKTSRDRPPSIRGQSGAIGRYAVVGHGLDTGEIEVEQGGSVITMTAVIPQDAETPSSVTADTTGLSTAADATTTVRVRRGDSRQTIRERVGIVLHAPEIGDDALVWRNENAITREGNQWGQVVVENGTAVDTFSNDRAEAVIRVNADPGVFDRVRHWIDANVTLPGLPFGAVAFDPDVLLVIGALVAVRRRDPPEPPTPHTPGQHRQPNPQEV